MNITLDEIKSKAPEGATHYDNIGYYFHKTDDGYFVYSKISGLLSTSPYLFTESQLVIYGIKPL